MALIEIDGLPFLKMVIFHGKLLNNQMVYYLTWPSIYVIRDDMEVS